MVITSADKPSYRVRSGETRRPLIIVATLLRRTGGTGVQAHVNGLLGFLERQQIRATCVTPFLSPRALVNPIFACRRLVEPFSGEFSVWWYRHWHGKFLERELARTLAREVGPVVIYAQCPVSAAAALKARRRPDQRVVMAIHFNISHADEWADSGYIDREGAFYRNLRHSDDLVLQLVDGLIYSSKFMQAVLETRIPSLRGILSAAIPNFVDLPPRRDAVRNRDLVNVGTLEPRKNQAFLLEVLREAAARGHRYTLTFAGDGQDRSALTQMAEELSVADQVDFLGFRSDTQEIVAQHRAFCHVALKESFPLSLLDAMALGVPVVTAPVGGIPEMIRDGIDGVFWRLDSPDAAARTLIEHMQDEGRLEALGAAGRQRVSDCFTTDIVAPRLLDFLNRA